MVAFKLLLSLIDFDLVHFDYDYLDHLVKILKKMENGLSFNDHLVQEE